MQAKQIAALKKKLKSERELEADVKKLEGSSLQRPSCAKVQNEYYGKKAGLDAFNSQAAERLMLWSRANWLESGENPAKFFLICRKRKAPTEACAGRR